MEECEFCGKRIGEYEYVDYRGVKRIDYGCDGIRTSGPDPYAEEIYGDSSDYLMCEGERYESSMDI